MDSLQAGKTTRLWRFLRLEILRRETWVQKRERLTLKSSAHLRTKVLRGGRRDLRLAWSGRGMWVQNGRALPVTVLVVGVSGRHTQRRSAGTK